MAADVATTLAGWSSTSGSNNPAGTTSISTNLDENLREIQGVIVRGLSYKGADIASAATTDLGAVEGLMHDITGTTTITSFGTVRAGIWKIVKFEGALTLTHNSTSLILPGGANILTTAGDIGIFISEGSGNWRCVSYTPNVLDEELGFTPVEQGGGTGQGTNKLRIGWLGTALGLQVDTTNHGSTWPISISGNAATATTATSASSASSVSSGVVGTATAGLALGAVGSYALIKANFAIAQGATAVHNANINQTLEYSDAAGTALGSAVTGTWRCMGVVGASGGVSLFLRVS